MMKNRLKFFSMTWILFLTSPVWMGIGTKVKFQLQAEPSWARKYNAQCTLCHTTYPRLNRTGYEFRRLGYRLPQELQAKATLPPKAANLQAAHEPVVTKPTGYKPKPGGPESEKGRAIYEKLNCAGCHSINNLGGHIGPPVDGIGGRRDPEFLTGHITNPEEHAKKFPELHAGQANRMPHPHATPEEVKLIVAYLLTLPEPAAGFRVSPHTHGQLSESPMAASDYAAAPVTESSRAGQKLYYEQGCPACHAIGKVGGQFGPRVDGVGARRGRRFILAHITNAQLHAEQFPGEHAGGSGAMPPTSLAPEEMEKVVDFLMTLSEEQDFRVPKTRVQDYFAVSYVPAIEIEKQGGETNTTYERRELIVYAAGPLGRNFSFFVQPLPLSEEKGFGGKFEMAQGLFNYGNARNFTQVRFGQLFNLRNAGFGGADRGLTETLPLVFQPVNGFSPAGLGRGVSLEYTLQGSTTFKVFGNYNEVTELEVEEEQEPIEPLLKDSLPARVSLSRRVQQEEEPLVPELLRSRNYGFVYEQVLGNKGLNGVQFEFAGGYTPLLIGEFRQPALRFQRYSFFANKTFEDGKNFERLNAIFGLSFLRDNRLLGIDSEQRSRGYGYFLEVDTIPVVNHLSFFGRYDQLRPTTLISDNTVRAGTFGVIYDVVKYARVLFEYQRLARADTVNGLRIGWQLNF
ncbi:MAG: cytochrome c [Acidobacteriota bacterium]